MLAGCGGARAPTLDHADAAPLIVLAHRITQEGSAGRGRDVLTLQRRVIALVNSGRVPGKLQEPLTSAVNALTVSPASARALEAWLKQNSR